MSGSTTCILCGTKLSPTTADGILLHHKISNQSIGCQVVLTDELGVSIDDRYELIAGTIYEREEPAPPDPDVIVAFEQYTPFEKALEAVFAHFGVERLGGASGDRGWSAVSAYQRCPYLWFKTYVAHQVPNGNELVLSEPLGLAIGSIVHTFLAVHYQKRINARYPLTPELVRKYLDENAVNPAFVTESWRLFSAYRLYYKNEPLQPLAIEHHVVDPRSKESCRYDAIVEILENGQGYEPGTWIMDHKTTLMFDRATLEGWPNDGTVIQQVMLWHRLGLHRRWGELKGVIVNLIGKQKIPGMHRAFVSPLRWQIDQQAADLRVWDAQKKLALATSSFPRSRANCVNRYGMCRLFDHCATGEE